MSVAKALGLDRNQAALSANSATIKACGVDVLEMLDLTHLAAPHQEADVIPLFDADDVS